MSGGEGAQPTTSWAPLEPLWQSFHLLQYLMDEHNAINSKNPKWIQNHAQIPMMVAM